MNRTDSSKSFAAIHTDYAFFQEHSSEAAEDIKSYLSHLLPLASSRRRLHLLDFGCGDGAFLVRLLSRAGFDSQCLRLSLVEPDAAYRRQAVSCTQSLSTVPVSAWTSLPTGIPHGFDLIVANHVLYYVKDLAGTLRQLLTTLSPDGLGLIAMGGRENVLCQILAGCFSSIQEPIPYFMAEDLEEVLTGLGQEFQKDRIPEALIFPDREENRLKMLRFMLGEHLARLECGKILQLFDPYAVLGRIVITTCHYQFVIRK